MKSVLIVGGGVSGLSCGIFALKNGYDVTLCESHFKVGGNLTGWDRQGFHIDNCIHWLTGTNPISSEYKKWIEVGAFKGGDIYQHNSFYTVFDKEGNSISLYKDLHKTKKEMLAISIEDEREITSFINAVREVKKILGFSGVNNDIKSSFIEKVKGVKSLLKYYPISLNGLSKKFKHPLLKRLISGFIGGAFSSLGLIFAYATFCADNGGVVYGGSYKMAMNMKDKFLSLGGTILTKTKAEKVVVEGDLAREVLFENGKTIQADYIVLATDIETAYYKLLNYPLPNNLKNRLVSKEMLRFSSVHTAISYDGVTPPFLNEGIIPVDKKYFKIIKSRNLVIREFSYQKDFAPIGKILLQTMTLCNENTCRNWIALKGDILKYNRAKMEFSKCVIEIIEGFFPSLKGRLKIIDCWTPATYNNYTGEKNGSYMSYILPPKTIPTSLTNRVKGVKNLVLATQWLQPIGGLPIALNKGEEAVKTLNKLNRNIKENKLFLLKAKSQ